ncbi:MAG: alpha/beta hydrolase [Xanthomonadaceae bacterium]|jgi:pimeloyl-ACP methyl ester carboxylesterase|nr:alpha/beta hydrolase [Xanthomonadaceae bacterium]
MNTLATIRTANRVVGTLAPTLAARFARKLLMTPQRHREKDHERAARASAEPVTFRFGLSGVRWGDAGPVVLAMHGWSGRPTQFAAFVAPLVASGRQVIALDAPAHGRSPGSEAHVFSFVEAILEAGSELKGIESVIGHSMGGAAALYAAHLGLPVQRVATIGAPAALRRVLARFADWVALPPPAASAFLARVNRHVGVDADEMDVARFAGRLGFEGLVVHDRDDREVPFAEAQALAAAWPAARTLYTRGLGHNRILADAGVVDAAVRFLAAAPSARRVA